MGRREKREKQGKAKSAKFDYESEEEEEQERDFNNQKKKNSTFVFSDSDDDREANEDLSLKIVQKAMSRASHAAAADNGGFAETSDVSFDEDCITTEMVASKSTMKKKKVKKEKKKNKVKTTATEIQATTMAMEEEVLDTVNGGEEEVKKSETTEGADDDNTNSENAVLRRLLRGPRYFDPPDKSWGSCFNCGEEGHLAVNCTSARRKKPCFICGSLEHEAKQCQKGQDCFICKGGGHRAKDCPQKFKRCSQNTELCLKCGGAAHALSSCNNDYSSDDLKEIQCYVCKKFGHLCCTDYSDGLPSEASCYKCGQSGHYGLDCRGARGETSAGTPSTCYKCGKEGHFARECTNSVKAKKRSHDLSTPKGKRFKDNKGYKAMKSAPQEFGKAHKKKKLQFDNGSPDWSSKSKRRGGWITEDPGDFTHRNVWRSPATPTKQHKIYSITAGGQGSSPQSYKKWAKYSPGTSSSHGYTNGYQHRYSASRFGYANSDGMRRNRDWW